MKKAQEKKLDVFGTAKVGEISKKVQESRLKWHGHVSIEKRRRICEQESDGDGGAGEKKEKTKAEVAAERLVGERTVRRRSTSVS